MWRSRAGVGDTLMWMLQPADPLTALKGRAAGPGGAHHCDGG